MVCDSSSLGGAVTCRNIGSDMKKSRQVMDIILAGKGRKTTALVADLGDVSGCLLYLICTRFGDIMAHHSVGNSINL